MEENKNFEKKISNDQRNRGRNFNEPPLSFAEFLASDKNGSPIYNNFFYNFLDGNRNYEMLKKINENLTKELSSVYERFSLSRGYLDQEILKNNLKGHKIVEGHIFPEEILKKGYEAYLLLRENFKNDKDLIKRIEEYYGGNQRDINNQNETDDWPAFFS